MPFITEELWHDELLGERAVNDCCIVAQLPTNGKINSQLLSEVEIIKQVITQIRNIRKSKQIPDKEKLELSIKENSAIVYKNYKQVITRLGNISTLTIVDGKISGSVNFMVTIDEFYVPFTESLDPISECIRLQKEKEYLTGFLKSVNSKLGNERFMSNAKPGIIQVELKKKADAEAKLKILEENILALAC